jgi:hypothetical protein
VRVEPRETGKILRDLRLLTRDSGLELNVTPAGNKVVEREHGAGILKEGTAFDDGALVSTNIYEKQGERWLMVSHQAQSVPK